MGAVGEGGALVVNERVVRRVQVSDVEFAEVETRERAEVERRALQFRGDRPRLALAARTALVVDDGIATGSMARAACHVARAQGAARVVLAAPVCSPEAARALRAEVDELVCLEKPRWFSAVGQCYAYFRPTSDGEVAALLQAARHDAEPADSPADDGVADEEVELPAGPGTAQRPTSPCPPRPGAWSEVTW